MQYHMIISVFVPNRVLQISNHCMYQRTNTQEGVRCVFPTESSLGGEILNPPVEVSHRVHHVNTLVPHTSTAESQIHAKRAHIRDTRTAKPPSELGGGDI